MANRIAGIILFLFGLYVFVESWNLAYTLNRIPGPGFMPKWVSLFIMILAIVPIVKSFRQGESDEKQPFNKPELKNAGVIVGSAIMAIVLSRVLGLCLAIGLMCGAIAKFTGPTSWKKVIGITVATPVGAFLIFDVILGVPLPRGIFGF